MDNEQHYGVEVANAGILGCAFTTTGELTPAGSGSRSRPDADRARAVVAQRGANSAPAPWSSNSGYRDQFDWKINGKVVHLGERAFDDQVQSAIDRYVSVLGQDGRKVVFLSIPYTSPPPKPDGSPSPARRATG